MSDNLEPQVNEPDNTPESTPELELNPIEQKAVEQGWMPKEKWVESGKDEAEWRDAQTFVDRGELLGQIKEQRRYIKQLQGTMESFKEHHRKVAEVEYKRAVADLKRQHRDAVADGDLEKAEQIVDQIQETRVQLNEDLSQAKAGATAAEAQRAFESWQEKNNWYAADDVMRAYADAQGFKIAKALFDENGAPPDPAEVLSKVAEKVREKFPEKFQPRKTTAPNPVAGTGKTPASTKKGGLSEADLDPIEAEMMRGFVRDGLMTKEEYLADLAKVRGR